MITQNYFFWFWGYRPPGSRTPGLLVAIFAYFDQHSVRFFLLFFLQETRFIKDIGYNEVIQLPNNNQCS